MIVQSFLGAVAVSRHTLMTSTRLEELRKSSSMSTKESKPSTWLFGSIRRSTPILTHMLGSVSQVDICAGYVGDVGVRRITGVGRIRRRRRHEKDNQHWKDM